MKVIVALENKLAHFGFDSQQERIDGIQGLRAEGFNYFVTYKDTQSPYAVQAIRVEDTKVWPWCEDRNWYVVQ